ncbi:PTS system sucrose-specific IIC component [Streptomyces sp. DSM 42143]|uniref:PTS transporter subunit EIIC n=1 Tax=Streptomyces sp. DSM 42143 TaxID=2817711 RepID=UPI0027876C62|nr:PTS transporter subunit EIIC [Streptomyces sp. DSM 42143]MDQ0387076.1 PTS system sucrose-specific IIC component [Streptomyces sp. DSM 42143]
MHKDPHSTAAALLPLVGGAANVTSVAHCMTRLRLGLADRSRVDDAALRALPGVLGVVEDGDSYQVVLGPGVVGRVTEAFEALLAREDDGGTDGTPNGATDIGADRSPNGATDGSPNGATDGSPNGATDGSPYGVAGVGTDRSPGGTADALARRGAELKARQKARNATPLKTALRRVANIFVPLIPALIGCGIVAGVAGLLTNLRWLPALTPALAALSSAFMALIAVFVGHNTAKEFGGTPVLGGAVAAVVVYPGVAKVTAFGAALAPGQGGVLGALAAAMLGTYVEKWCRARLPGTLDVLLTPTLTVLVSGLVTLYVLMYAAGEVATAIGTAANWLLTTTGALAGLVLGGLFLPLVMLGLHQALIPIHTTLIEQQGHTVLLPILAMAGAGQVGAAAAVYVRLRHDTTLRTTIRSALPAGLLGVGEPLIYGVSLPLGRPFLTACVGGAAGGAFVGLFAMLGTDVGATAIGPSGWALFPLLAGGGGWAVTAGVYGGGLLTGYVVGFLATYFFGLPDGAARPVCDPEEHEPRPADRPGPRPASPR